MPPATARRPITHIAGISPLPTLALLLCLVSPTKALAYNVFPFFLGQGTGYLKWGDNHAGTPGGVVTWSLMPNGTTLDPTAPTWIQGTSNLTSVFNQVGGEAGALSVIQAAFDHWSAVANVQFVYVGVDDGTPFNASYSPTQVVGDIRIGAFLIDGFSAAVGFAAPPNGGTTLEGDVIFNTNPDISFYMAPGNEGDLYDLYPPGGGFYRNDFEGLISHEIGHALGLAHSDVVNSLMCGYVSPSFDGTMCAYFDPDMDGRAPINRLPDADDIAGIQFLYGLPASADFDVDTDVDGVDFLAWQRGVVSFSGGGASTSTGDADRDLNVDDNDFRIWADQWGGPTPVSTPLLGSVPANSPASVPEPAGSTLPLWLGIGLLARRLR